MRFASHPQSSIKFQSILRGCSITPQYSGAPSKSKRFTAHSVCDKSRQILHEKHSNSSSSLFQISFMYAYVYTVEDQLYRVTLHEYDCFYKLGSFFLLFIFNKIYDHQKYISIYIGTRSEMFSQQNLSDKDNMVYTHVYEKFLSYLD